jgi:SSS family solute:Na+ symporter
VKFRCDRLHPVPAAEVCDSTPAVGGVWIIQTLPVVVLGLYTGWLHRHALLIGWAVGIVAGTAMVASLGFSTSMFPIVIGGLTIPCYAALASLVINLAIAVEFAWLFNIAHAARRRDESVKFDYQEAAP